MRGLCDNLPRTQRDPASPPVPPVGSRRWESIEQWNSRTGRFDKVLLEQVRTSRAWEFTGASKPGRAL